MFDDKQLGDENDSEVPNKKRKICFGYDEYEPEGRDYRLKAEIEKLKIMQIIQECFLKLAEDGILDSVLGVNGRTRRMRDFNDHFKSFSCKRFILPWIMVKVIQIVSLSSMKIKDFQNLKKKE